MKKELSVVFPIYEDKQNKKFFILMGKYAEGKKMPGIRNGYGGKCEVGESTLACAKRELAEEAGIEKDVGEFKKVGSVFMDDKRIDFFTLFLDEKITEPADNSEFVDTKWFDLGEAQTFVNEMLSGDEVVIEKLKNFLEKKEESTFEINKTGDKKLEGQVKNIYR